MARDHVEFVQSQVLPFSKGLYGGARPELDMRILSIDNEAGDASTMLKWPAEWSRTESEHLDCDEEFLQPRVIENNRDQHAERNLDRKTKGTVLK